MAKYKVNRRNYSRFVQDCADKCYKGIMTWAEYKNMKIELEPIDFTPYPAIKTETQKWIEALFTDEDTDRNGNYMLRGFTYREYAEKEKLGCVMGDGGNGYSWWAFNDTEMLIYTYCEGDTTLTLCPTREIYESEKERSRVFYTEQF